MLKLTKKQTGFTIVELLIVIVVIALLAAISIVAYNGIQDRAEAAKTTAAVRAYKNALSLYKLDNGSYPSTGAFCLGDQYEIYGGGAVPSCRYSTSEIADTLGAAQRDGLKPYLGNKLPMPSTKLIVSGSTLFVGAHFYGSSYNITLDGTPAVGVEYYIKGSSCPVGPVYSSFGAATSPAVTRSQALGNDSRCYLILLDA